MATSARASIETASVHSQGMDVPVISGRNLQKQIPYILPDLLRSVDSLARRNGADNVTMIVCLMMAAAAGSRRLGIDGMTYVTTALEAWGFVVAQEKAAEPTVGTKAEDAKS